MPLAAVKMHLSGIKHLFSLLVSRANSGYSPEKIQDKLGIGIILAPKPENMKRYATHGEAMPIDDIACNYYYIL